MKRFLLTIIALCAVFSCGKIIEPDSITVSPKDRITSSANGVTQTLNVKANNNWTSSIKYSSGSGWCSVSPASGDASIGSVSISITPNTEGEERNAEIIFICGDSQQVIAVTQQQNDVVEISKNTYEISASGGAVQVKVRSNVGYTFDIDSDAKSWISYVNTRAITESTVSFMVSENKSLSSRQGKIVFRYGSISEIVTISQKGITPSLSISPSSSNLGVEGGTIEIKVSSNYDYKASIPAECKNWISLVSENVSQKTHVYKVAVNNGPETRNGSIDFSISDYKKSHSISQAGNPTLETNDYSFSFEPEGGSGTIRYSGNFKCETNISANWITISSHSYSNNQGTIVFSVAKNEGQNSRVDCIKLTGYGLSILVSIKQNEVLDIVSITTTQAGTLSSFLGSSQIYQIKAYKISGPLNSADFAIIRSMAGSKGDKLKYLDLSDATIVSGGWNYWYEKYYYNGYRYDKNHKYTTKDNTITSYMFTDCWRLETIILPKSVTTIEKNAFFDFGITSITLPDNIQKIESSFDSYSCKEILLNKNNRYYTIVKGILYSKDMKTLLSCPAENDKIVGRYEIPSSVEVIYPKAFYSCRKITDLVIPQSVQTVGEYAFAWCTLESITIYPMTKYGLLGYNTKFHNVIIPNGYAEFDASIFVPGNIDVRGNVKIDDLWVYCKTPPQIDTWSQFNSDNKKNTVLHVPKGSLSAYKLAYCWGEFKNIQEFNPY